MDEDDILALTSNGIEKLYEDQFGVARRGVQEPLTLQITSVLRYECDSGWLSATGLDLAEGEAYVYDVIFNDGVTRSKCLLAPALARRLFHRRNVEQYDVVVVTSWMTRPMPASLIFDTRESFVIITHLDVLQPGRGGVISYLLTEDGNAVLPPYDRDDWNADPKIVLRPLVGSRGYYLHELADDAPLDKRWCEIAKSKKRSREMEEEPGPGDPIVFVKYPTLGSVFIPIENNNGTDDELLNLSDVWQNLGPGPEHKQRLIGLGFVCGRVTRKSHLALYGQLQEGKKPKKYPMNFTITIADSTSSIDVVLWEGLCAMLYGRIQLGDILIIRNFNVKNGYEDPTKLEIHCNPSFPRSSIEIVVPPSTIAQELNLPDVTLNMVSQYEDLLDFEDRHEGVAVIGLVTAVFEPFIYHTRSGRFSMARWVFLREHRTQRDLAVKIPLSAQLTTFHRLKISDVLLLTSLRVRSLDNATIPDDVAASADRSATSRRLFFLEGSRFTQVHRNKHLAKLKNPLDVDFAPYVTFESSGMPFRNFYFRTGSRFLFHEQLFYRPQQEDEDDEAKEHHTVALSEVTSIVKAMRYRERRLLSVNARIKNITFQKESQQQAALYKVQLVDVDRASPTTVALPTHSVLCTDPSGLLDLLHSNSSSKQANGRAKNLLSFLPETFIADHKDDIVGASTESKLLSLLNASLPKELFEVILDVFVSGKDEADTEIVLINVFNYRPPHHGDPMLIDE